jgi:hypothetical protein
MQAQIILEYSTARTSHAVAEAISPDNVRTPKGLSIETFEHGKRVVTTIDYDGRLATFIATIDDLLFSASTAEKTIETARKLC